MNNLSDTDKYQKYKDKLISALKHEVNEREENAPWKLTDYDLPNSPLPNGIDTGEFSPACRFIRRFVEGKRRCEDTHEKFVRGVSPSVELKNLHSSLEFPGDLKQKTFYNSKNKRLIFKGIMSQEEKQGLQELSKDDEYRKAIELLFAESQPIRDLNNVKKNGNYVLTCWVGVMKYIVCPITVGGKRRVWLLGQRLISPMNSKSAAATVASTLVNTKERPDWESIKGTLTLHLTEIFKKVLPLDKTNEEKAKGILKEYISEVEKLKQVDFKRFEAQSNSDNDKFTVSLYSPLTVEMAYYEENKKELLAKYEGKYVAMKGCKVICVKDTESEVVEEVYARGATIGGRFVKGSEMGGVLIRKVTKEPSREFIFAQGVRRCYV